MTRAVRPGATKTLVWLSWLIPPLFCLLFYWDGLLCWFRQDDFAWLQLAGTVHSWGDFWRAMFTPMAEGTIRPWSDRGYFMGLYTLFGLDALPFRIVVFVTQFANLTLIRAITQRITGSAAAGVWAALLWVANGALIVLMTWSSAYNQALCGFFLLLAFYFLLRYIESGDWRDNAAQWAAFLLGFGALELNVVYPALAGVYTLLCARAYFGRTLPLWIPAMVFTAIHRAVAPPAAPLYHMNFGFALWETLGRYILWARGVNHYRDPGLLLRLGWSWGSVAILAVLAAFALRQAIRGHKAALFFAAWFFIVLAPVLPLTDHVSEYYLTLPAIGLAMLAGWALVEAWASGVVWRAAAIASLLVYLSALPANWKETRARYLFSRRIENLTLGVEEARNLHPGKVILLQDVDDYLFWQGILDRPFAAAGIRDVFLTPETEASLTVRPELGDIHDFLLPAAATLDALEAGRVVVYSVAGEKIRNTTRLYTSLAPTHLRRVIPRRVDVANPLLASLLGKSWYPIDGKHRWMPKSATLRLGGPSSTQQRLYLTGYTTAEQWKSGPLPIDVSVDGIALPRKEIPPGIERFDFDYALPANLLGKGSVEVALEVGRTFRSSSGSELGVVFGTIEIR